MGISIFFFYICLFINELLILKDLYIKPSFGGGQGGGHLQLIDLQILQFVI